MLREIFVYLVDYMISQMLSNQHSFIPTGHIGSLAVALAFAQV